MKRLTKLALVSAMAFSANAMAAQLQALDEEEMSAMTGQDGITIRLSQGISFDELAIHDGDGLGYANDAAAVAANVGFTTEAAGNNSGAIVIGSAANPFELATGGLDIKLDAVGGADPVLNVGIDFGNTTLNIGTISVADTTYTTAARTTFVTSNKTDAIEIGSISLQGLKVNVQLGNAPQGGLIKVTSSITGGLVFDKLEILSNTTTLVKTPADAGPPPVAATYYTPSSLYLDDLTIKTNGSGDLALNLTIDPTTDGLVIKGLGGLDITARNVGLGNQTAGAGTTPNLETITAGGIGGLSISNLRVGDIILKGH